MPVREMILRLVGKDDLSKVVDKAADKVDELESMDATVTLAADVGTAERDIDGLISKIDKLGAGDVANLLITTNATQIVNEIADLTLELDRLDANDPRVDVTVDNINRAQSDLDRLQAKAMEVNDTPIRFDTAGAVRGINDVSGAASGANSAFANMVGNSAQDLGQLGGAAGSAGVAIGQMAEYTTDAALQGRGLAASLGSMAKVAGPMAALGVTTQIIGQHFAEAAQGAENARLQILGMTEAIREGTGAADLFADQLERTNQLELRGIFDQGAMTDIADELIRAGVTVEQFGAAVEAGAPGVERLAAAMHQVGVDSETGTTILTAAALAADDWSAAGERAAGIAEILGTELDAATEPRTAEINVEETGADAAAGAIAEAAEDEDTTIHVGQVGSAAAKGAITGAAQDQDTVIDVRQVGASAAAGAIAAAARDRTATINVKVVGLSAASGAIAGAAGARSVAPTATALGPSTMAAPVAAPAVTYTPAPIVINVPAPKPTNVTIQAGVVGNRYDVERVVARSLRAHARLNGGPR